MQQGTSVDSMLAPRGRAFTLVTTLVMLSILVVLIAVVGATISLSQRQSSASGDLLDAQKSALAGLEIALGEMQTALGPDQRATGSADLFSDSSNLLSSGLSLPEGHNGWAGVWRSDTVGDQASGVQASFSPKEPNQKDFLGWLVSGLDASGNFILPENLEDVETELNPEESIVLFSDDLGPRIRASKVKIKEDSRRGNVTSSSYFAFAVEDEGLKADLTWSEIPDSINGDDQRAQNIRLSSVPGPDYSVFDGGPFDELSYPLSADDLIVQAIAQSRDPKDLPSLLDGASEEWITANSRNFTWGSKGVLSDSKWGGLRRDLSLAFEMDGEADLRKGESLTRFNSQEGEFVGGQDRLTAGYPSSTASASKLWAEAGLGVLPRYPHRDSKDSGTPFADDIFTTNAAKFSGNSRGSATAPVSLRGPTWWLLRDFANLYKRLEGSDGDYTLQARPYYPNSNQNTILRRKVSVASGRGSLPDLEEDWRGLFADRSNGRSHYIFRPAQGNYTPVCLGATTLVSLRANAERELKVVVDVLVYYWNPFNHKLKTGTLVTNMNAGMPGKIRLSIDRSGSTTIQEVTLRQLLAGKQIRCRFSNELTLDPGEVMIATLRSETELVDGYGGFSTSSGVELDLGTTLQSGDQVGYVFRKGVATDDSARNEISTLIGAEEVQMLHFPHHATSGTNGNTDFEEFFSPQSLGSAPVNTVSIDSLVNTKRLIGVVSTVMKPASWTGPKPNQLEVFSRFNPMPIAFARDFNRICQPNQIFHQATGPEPGPLLQDQGVSFSASPGRAAFWGASFESLSGTKSFPFVSLPSAPLVSLVSLTHANWAVTPNEAIHPIGNSWPSPYTPTNSPYGVVTGNNMTMQDLSWNMNNALFDRYFFSGLAPAFSFVSGRYDSNETLREPLNRFYEVDGSDNPDFRSANANPVIVPLIPSGKTAEEIAAELNQNDGYKRIAAYSLINGAFNVNSTSVDAWEAFLRSNKNLDVKFSDGGTDSDNGVPFPKSSFPAAGVDSEPLWGSFSRLNDEQIRTLAEEIVKQVRLRGPFMSLSDFINRRMDDSPGTLGVGALQAAIDEAGINQVVQNEGGGSAVQYPNGFFFNSQQTHNRPSATGIPGEINQAELLLPIAPRLTSRSDTFRIRAYGERRSNDDKSIVSSAVCEAVVQRFPEYVDPQNEPWEEALDPISQQLNESFSQVNRDFGRRFRIVQFRWLSPNEE